MKLAIQLLRIVVAYFLACIGCAIGLYFWLILLDRIGGYHQYNGFVFGLFRDLLMAVVVTSFVPAAICFVIAEKRGLNSKMTYSWAGLLVSLWPFIPMFYLLPMFIFAPVLGFIAGLCIWYIAGQHAGQWRKSNSVPET